MRLRRAVDEVTGEKYKPAQIKSEDQLRKS